MRSLPVSLPEFTCKQETFCSNKLTYDASEKMRSFFQRPAAGWSKFIMFFTWFLSDCLKFSPCCPTLKNLWTSSCFSSLKFTSPSCGSFSKSADFQRLVSFRFHQASETWNLQRENPSHAPVLSCDLIWNKQVLFWCSVVCLYFRVRFETNYNLWSSHWTCLCTRSLPRKEVSFRIWSSSLFWATPHNPSEPRSEPFTTPGRTYQNPVRIRMPHKTKQNPSRSRSKYKSPLKTFWG